MPKSMGWTRSTRHTRNARENRERAVEETIIPCKITNGKLECEADPGSVPSIPVRTAWLVIIASFVLLVVAAVLNHVIFSTGSAYYVFPFFGGIQIARGTLYDVSLVLFVIAPVMIVVVFAFTVKYRTKIISIRD